jgi:hypothetical protein
MQRSGQHTLARQKIIQKKTFLLSRLLLKVYCTVTVAYTVYAKQCYTLFLLRVNLLFKIVLFSARITIPFSFFISLT